MSYDERRPYSSGRFSEEKEDIQRKRETGASGSNKQDGNHSGRYGDGSNRRSYSSGTGRYSGRYSGSGYRRRTAADFEPSDGSQRKTAADSTRTGQRRNTAGTDETGRNTGTGVHRTSPGTDETGKYTGTGLHRTSPGTGRTRKYTGTGQRRTVAGSGQRRTAAGTGGTGKYTGTGQRKTSSARKNTGRRVGRNAVRVTLGFVVGLLIFTVIVGVSLFGYSKYQEHLQKKEAEELRQETLKEAKHMAAGYDYDGAIDKVTSLEGASEDPEIQKAVTKWNAAKEKLVEYKAGDVTHIFYHTLVRDPKLAFECAPSIANGFKKWMTTIEEFSKITQTMYDEGYVLCSLYDFFEETYDENGVPHFKEKSVWLPKNKKPFVLSLDDLSYYHTYTGHGMASRLVVDEDGKVTCEYENEDGTVERGSFDCVPLLDDFMEEHPDGAYHDARGTIALTGYNGIFGYRTDESYMTRENLDADKVEWLEAHKDYDRKVEIYGAENVAKALKEEGWTFASHTWGHIRIGNTSLKKIKIDTEKWLRNVQPIIGKTECIIFAHGQDLSSNDEYDTENNEKYKYLSEQGFHIFLNVDSHQKTMQVHDLYVHGGRRNLDGYRLWSDAHGWTDWTSDLFVASEILDSRRKDMPSDAE